MWHTTEQCLLAQPSSKPTSSIFNLRICSQKMLQVLQVLLWEVNAVVSEVVDCNVGMKAAKNTIVSRQSHGWIIVTVTIPTTTWHLTVKMAAISTYVANQS
jgi:hypothetical protein